MHRKSANNEEGKRGAMRGRDEPKNPLSRVFSMGALLRFALPTIVMMLFMGLYTVTDTVFVSRFVGTNALSALNIVCPVINLIVGLGTMLATGGSAIVARKMGAGEGERAARDFTLLFIACVCLGVVTAVLGLALLDPIIGGLGAGELLFPYCRQYLLVLLFFTPASMLQIFFQSFTVTAGRPGLGMALSVSAGAANVLLDYVLMARLDMGIAGAAMGTGIGYLLPTVIGILYFARAKGALRFRKPVWDPGALWKSCSNGVSELVSQAAAAVTTFLFNAVMMRLMGEDGVAAITILIYTQFMLTALYIGFSMGVAPVISYRYGSGDSEKLRSVFRKCLAFVGAASILVFFAAMACGGPFVAVFSPKGTAVYRIAREGFLIFPFSFLFCGLNIFTSAAFTALSDGKRSAAVSFLRTFGLITAALLVLPRVLGVTGVWLAVPLAECATCFLSLWLLGRLRGKNKHAA